MYACDIQHCCSLSLVVFDATTTLLAGREWLCQSLLVGCCVAWWLFAGRGGRQDTTTTAHRATRPGASADPECVHGQRDAHILLVHLHRLLVLAVVAHAFVCTCIGSKRYLPFSRLCFAFVLFCFVFRLGFFVSVTSTREPPPKLVTSA